MTDTLLPNRRILDKHFVAQAVSQPVKEYRLSAGSNAGDGVAGHLLSVDVQTESNEIHNLIFKAVLPLTGVIDQAVISSAEVNAATRAFEREILYYRDIVPMCRQITDDHKELSLFTEPKYYAGIHDHENALYDYLAIKDMRPSGYKMMDKFKGFNLEQMMGSLKELAVFHATSYCLLNGKFVNKQFVEMKNDPDCSLNHHGWDFPMGDSSILYNGLIRGMAEIAREQGQPESADRIIRKFGKTGFQIMWDLWLKTGKDDKYFPVLAHGDIWLNNILMKVAPDGKTISDVKFIDFQFIRFGNIYEDLHYLIFTSSTPEFRRNYLNTCLQHYFNSFAMVLKKLGDCPFPKGFSLDQFISVFYENYNYGVSINLTSIPFQLGIAPPPPSPMTPVDLELTLKKNGTKESTFFTDVKSKNGSSDTANDKMKAKLAEFEQAMENDIKSLLQGARNSSVALRWLKDLTEEMVELDCI